MEMRTNTADADEPPAAGGLRRMLFRGPYGMPRNYSLAALLTVCTGFAVLFALLTQVVGLHPLGILVFAVFTGGVGAGQALLFGGRKPRRASLLVGEILGIFAVPAMLTVPLLELHGLRWPGWLWDQYLEQLISALPFSIPLGPILGYVAGGVMAGVLLLLDLAERIWRPRRGTGS